jgi:hypothetical protein
MHMTPIHWCSVTQLVFWKSSNSNHLAKDQNQKPGFSASSASQKNDERLEREGECSMPRR